MNNYYTIPVEAKVGNSWITPEGKEILIAGIHKGTDYFDLEIIEKKSGVQGYLRCNIPQQSETSNPPSLPDTD